MPSIGKGSHLVFVQIIAYDLCGLLISDKFRGCHFLFAILAFLSNIHVIPHRI